MFIPSLFSTIKSYTRGFFSWRICILHAEEIFLPCRESSCHVKNFLPRMSSVKKILTALKRTRRNYIVENFLDKEKLFIFIGEDFLIIKQLGSELRIFFSFCRWFLTRRYLTWHYFINEEILSKEKIIWRDFPRQYISIPVRLLFPPIF